MFQPQLSAFTVQQHNLVSKVGLNVIVQALSRQSNCLALLAANGSVCTQDICHSPAQQQPQHLSAQHSRSFSDFSNNNLEVC